MPSNTEQLFRLGVLLVLLAGMSAFHSSGYGQDANRKAFVVGVSNYEHAPRLGNPGRDAKAMAEKLRMVGFKTSELIDPNLDQLRKEFRRFTLELTENDQVLFFFAGHGVQVKGTNYLLPADALLDDPDFIDYKTLSLDSVLTELDEGGSQLKIVILDCCRDNPFEDQWPGKRSTSKGMVIPTGSPKGTVLCFATAPGTVASDGRSTNSPYTEALLENLFVPGREIVTALRSAAKQVENKTEGDQVPWLNLGGLNESFYLIPGAEEGLYQPMTGVSDTGKKAALELMKSLNSDSFSELASALLVVKNLYTSEESKKEETELDSVVKARVELVCLEMGLQGGWQSDLEYQTLEAVAAEPFSSTMALWALANGEYSKVPYMVEAGQITEANESLRKTAELLDKGIARGNALCMARKGGILTRHRFIVYNNKEGLQIPGTPEEGFQLLQKAYEAFQSRYIETEYFSKAGMTTRNSESLFNASLAIALAQCWHHGWGTGKSAADDPKGGYAAKQSAGLAEKYYREAIEANSSLGEAKAGLIELRSAGGNYYWSEEFVTIAREGAEQGNTFCMYHYAKYLWARKRKTHEDQAIEFMIKAAEDGSDMKEQARAWLDENQ